MGVGFRSTLDGIGSHNRQVGLRNLQITYTITFNGNITDGTNLKLLDNAAPVASSSYGLNNEYVKGTSGSGYAPYIPSFDNTADFPVYYDSIKKSLQIDEVADGAGKLASYTNNSLGTIEGKTIINTHRPNLWICTTTPACRLPRR